jgi:hypothetical protein
MVTGFSGITSGIADPTVFNPPVMCMAGPIYPAVSYSLFSVKYGMSKKFKT